MSEKKSFLGGPYYSMRSLGVVSRRNVTNPYPSIEFLDRQVRFSNVVVCFRAEDLAEEPDSAHGFFDRKHVQGNVDCVAFAVWQTVSSLDQRN